MEQFVAFFRDSFDQANIPNPNDTYTNIMANNNYLMELEGNTIRVIFSSHPTGNRAYYQNIGARDKIVTALKEEYDLGHLTYNGSFKHLDRTEGECEYCNNELFYIGTCPYGKWMRRLQGVPNDSLVWMKMAAPHNATGNNFTLLVNFPDKVNEK